MLFCHITSRMEGALYPDLLKEKGGRGFPHLVFMDSDGNVIAVHRGQRTIEEFTKTADKAKTFQDLKAKAAAGDPSAAGDFFLQQIELGQLKADEVAKRLGEMKDLAQDKREKAETMLFSMEIRQIASNVPRKGPERAEAGHKFLAMKKAGRIPSEEADLQPFWILIMDAAEEDKDAALYEEALSILKARFGQNPRSAKFFAQKEQLLNTLKGATKEGTKEQVPK